MGSVRNVIMKSRLGNGPRIDFWTRKWFQDRINGSICNLFCRQKRYRWKVVMSRMSCRRSLTDKSSRRNTSKFKYCQHRKPYTTSSIIIISGFCSFGHQILITMILKMLLAGVRRILVQHGLAQFVISTSKSERNGPTNTIDVPIEFAFLSPT